MLDRAKKASSSWPFNGTIFPGFLEPRKGSGRLVLASSVESIRQESRYRFPTLTWFCSRTVSQNSLFSSPVKNCSRCLHLLPRILWSDFAEWTVSSAPYSSAELVLLKSNARLIPISIVQRGNELISNSISSSLGLKLQCGFSDWLKRHSAFSPIYGYKRLPPLSLFL